MATNLPSPIKEWQSETKHLLELLLQLVHHRPFSISSVSRSASIALLFLFTLTIEHKSTVHLS